jgi:hypothetical protein
MNNARKMFAVFAMATVVLGACGSDDDDTDNGGGTAATLGPLCQQYEDCCEELAADNGAMADACTQAMDQYEKALAQDPSQKDALETSCEQALSGAQTAGYCQ